MADASGPFSEVSSPSDSGALLAGGASTSAPSSRPTSPTRRQGSVPLPNTLPTSRVGKSSHFYPGSPLATGWHADHDLVTFLQRVCKQATDYADRLLLQRLRKSQSGTALYKQAQVAEEQQERSVCSSYDSGSSQRLLVVANRLPVSAYRDKEGRWQLQVDHLPDEEVMFAHSA